VLRDEPARNRIDAPSIQTLKGEAFHLNYAHKSLCGWMPTDDFSTKLRQAHSRVFIQ
jgi:hypothetical protein